MVGQGSSKGDEVANFLVENATTLGITLIIWNRTLWKVTPSGPQSRPYSGPNPHTDHVHAEVSSAIAANGPGQVDPGQVPGGEEPGGQEPGGQKPGGKEPGGEEPGGEGPYDQGPYGEEDEVECVTDRDCDPNGELICDQGYCFESGW